MLVLQLLSQRIRARTHTLNLCSSLAYLLYQMCLDYSTRFLSNLAWIRSNEMSQYLLVGVLLLQHDGQPLQEGPHAGRHVEADDALLLQSCAASSQHVVGRHELFGTVHNQHILEMKQTRE